MKLSLLANVRPFRVQMTHFFLFFQIHQIVLQQRQQKTCEINSSATTYFLTESTTQKCTTVTNSALKDRVSVVQYSADTGAGGKAAGLLQSQMFISARERMQPQHYFWFAFRVCV